MADLWKLTSLARVTRAELGNFFWQYDVVLCPLWHEKSLIAFRNFDAFVPLYFVPISPCFSFTTSWSYSSTARCETRRDMMMQQETKQDARTRLAILLQDETDDATRCMFGGLGVPVWSHKSHDELERSLLLVSIRYEVQVRKGKYFFLWFWRVFFLWFLTTQLCVFVICGLLSLVIMSLDFV